MALNFPNSPTNLQTYLANGVLYVYDSTKTIWEATAGNGVTILDAATLDGIDSTSFLRSDIADTAAGIITFSDDINVNGEFTMSVGNALTATGTTQGTGLALTNTINRITVITAASAEAVVMPSAVEGKMVVIHNDDASDTLVIFPFSGDRFGDLALDASIELGPNGTLQFYTTNTTRWSVSYGTYA